MARYARTLASFVFFLCNLKRLGPRYQNSPLAMVGSSAVDALERSLDADHDKKDLLQCLGDLLIEVILARGTYQTNDDAQFPVFHFLALYNMRPEGTFPPPNMVTQSLAHLQYGFRMVMFWKLEQLLKERQLATSPGSVMRHYASLMAPEEPMAQQEVNCIWQFLAPLHAAQATNFSHMLSVKGWLAYHGYEHKEEPPCQWENTDYTSLSYRGHVVSLEAFRNGISQAIQDAKDMLDALSFGELGKGEERNISAFIDVKNNSHQGYSFLTVPENSLSFAKSPLLAKIGSTDAHEERFFYGTHEGKPLPNFPKIHQYLKDCKTFLAAIAALMHVTSGGPPRGKEAVMTRLFNDGSAYRNLFWVRGRIAWILFYNKSESQGGQRKPYPRFLNDQISMLLFDYLTVIRGFEAVLVQVVGTNDLAQDHMKWLFVDAGKRWSSSAYSDAIQGFFQQYLSQPIALRAYRQIQVTFAKKHLIANPILWDDKAFATRLEHEQAGHSSTTGSTRYGNVLGQLEHVGEDREIEFENCSVNWQRLVMSSFHENPIMVKTASGQSEENHKLNTRVEQIRQSFPLKYDGRALLKLLRQLFVTSTGVRFKDIKQADACAAVIQQNIPGTTAFGQNLLIVLPSGMGKTVTWLLPHIENPNQFTIVLVPLNALKDDLMHRVKSYSRFNVYGAEALQPLALDGLQPGIVICSYDQMTKDGVRGEISRCSKRISRIVYEEAHLSIMSKGFRPCMNSVSLAAHLGCPLTVVTATCPPSMTKALQEYLTIPTWKEIRSPCIRNNIIYQVNEADRSGATSIPERVYHFLQNSLSPILDNRRTQIIIFASTLSIGNKLEEISAYPFYHGQIDEATKSRLLVDFRENKTQCIIATNAFGAGIDIETVEIVIHAGAPWDFVSFAQESGRCGRGKRLGLSVIIPSTKTCRVFDSPDIYGQKA